MGTSFTGTREDLNCHGLYFINFLYNAPFGPNPEIL